MESNPAANTGSQHDMPKANPPGPASMTDAPIAVNTAAVDGDDAVHPEHDIPRPVIEPDVKTDTKVSEHVQEVNTAPATAAEPSEPASEAVHPQEHVALHNGEQQTHASAGNHPIFDDTLVPSLGATPADSSSSNHPTVATVPMPQVEEGQAPRISTGEQEWPLKSIYWPPLVDYPREVKILMQDLNGPCSFLALCNVLLLRGDIYLPLEQKSATFSQLSSLVGDYLLRISDGASSSNNLDFALNTLPKTLSGLDVNINFITGGFSSSSIGATEGDTYVPPDPSELELFKLAKVDFRHGWIISQDDDKEVFEVFVTVANDYDTAVNVLVEGDAVAEGHITGNSAPAGLPTAPDASNGAAAPASEADAAKGEQKSPKTTMSSAQKLEHLFEDLSMEPNKQAKVYQATVIQRFLQSTGTQLTYAGLFKLSETLQPGSLCALFRNSHFSVLYRRPDISVPSRPQAIEGGTTDAEIGQTKSRLPQATLFQLVTDQALLHERNAVWESLEDVDGAASQFYDSRLQPARIRQDWVSRNERDPAEMEQNNHMHDADMALAAQLQQDEYDAEDQARIRRTPHHQNETHHTNPAHTHRDEDGTRRRQESSNQSDQSQSTRTRAGKRPEDLDPRVLSGLGARTSKKQKEKEADGKKSKKDCIIC